MKPTKFPSVQAIRKSAGPHVDVYFCEDGGCYRATCHPGFAFESGSLHELIAYPYGSKGEARADLLERLSGPGAYVAEPCTDPECDWCTDPE